MIRIACSSLLVLLCACQPSPSPPPPQETASGADAAAFVLPGDFAESTTVDDLRARFGADHVVIEEPAPAIDAARRVVLFADDPARRAYVEFHDPEALAGIASITVRDAGSVWRGKHGVRIGMTFAQLRQANGGPFAYHGFDEDGIARVRDQWSPAVDDESRLGALDVDDGEHMYFGVDLALREGAYLGAHLREGAGTAPAADDWPRDESLSSDDPRYPRLGEMAVVTAMVASTSLDDEWE